ncbi:ABC transporter ATP-binding protein [Campylobacter concisus]|uniref:ABC transporter ATP-binding protein n=1 Tax=Campylobacter concisus TaxID=199 RepID=UPI000CD85CB8|nr:ATP-binding cassette domain-containing protein [Campylobacter concisus]QPH87461.1 ATP-binding cassette domain-containing protein [Campylobacter concisus]QPI02407.1 ATP-binding cassette domain-containing protein [Campylobacter concisus]
MLELKNVEYEILRDKVVRNFSLNVKGGEVVTLFGPSGCGKTTILRLISGLNEPRKGKIVNNFKKITYFFQENRLLTWKNALENVLLVMDKPDINAVLELFKKVGLSQKDILKYPSELSGGMRQRVAFVRAVVTKPDLLLMDEPFSGLDYDMKEILIEIIGQRVSEGMSVVLVTHDRMEAVKMSNRIYFLSSKGAVIQRELEIDKDFKERDFTFISKMIDENFKGQIYYD